jgi:hypothetical protein
MSTRWLRRERPYSLSTTARFAGPRELALAILRRAGAQGEAWTESSGCDSTLRVRVDIESSADSGDGLLSALIDDLPAYRIVITDGRFIAADGFTIEEDGVVAVPDEAKSAEDGVLTGMLRWRADGCER